MPKPSRNDIYESVIRRMVAQALEDQERNFSRDHAFDSDEQLIAYIREQAETLHYAPREKEIIGWKLIIERFGTWGQAIEKAGLRISSSCPVSKLPRIQKEVEKQKEVYRQKKAEKKIRAQQRLKEQNEKKTKDESMAQVCPLHQSCIYKLSDCPLDGFYPPQCH